MRLNKCVVCTTAELRESVVACKIDLSSKAVLLFWFIIYLSLYVLDSRLGIFGKETVP